MRHAEGTKWRWRTWQDDVECILNIIRKEVGDIYLGVANFSIRQGLVDEFMLTLRVHVPPTTGFLMYYWHIPTVVVDQ